MGRLAGFKYRDVAGRLRDFGFVLDRQSAGSHELWRNDLTLRTCTLPRHARDLSEGTVRSILQQAGINIDDFLSK